VALPVTNKRGVVATLPNHSTKGGFAIKNMELYVTTNISFWGKKISIKKPSLLMKVRHISFRLAIITYHLE
jgi:hypothetical protein